MASRSNERPLLGSPTCRDEFVGSGRDSLSLLPLYCCSGLATAAFFAPRLGLLFLTLGRSNDLGCVKSDDSEQSGVNKIVCPVKLEVESLYSLMIAGDVTDITAGIGGIRAVG